MNHRIQCQCGSLSGQVSQARSAVHAVCYCIDCGAYAHHLGRPERVLDALNGTDVVATQARYVTLTNGIGNLACMSLSPNGLLRWYAKCCNTPIANTPRDWRMPYVGLVHTCLEKPLESSFPPVQMRVGTKNAKARPPSMWRSQMVALLRFMPKILASRIAGTYRQTPFFSPLGAPIVGVEVLSGAQRDTARNAARSRDE